MDETEPLQVLLTELRRLRAEGVETVPLSAESVDILRTLKGQPKVAVPNTSTAPAKPLAEYKRDPIVVPTEPKPRAPVGKVDDSAIPEPPKVNLPAGVNKSSQMAALEEIVKACAECQRHLGKAKPLIFGAGSLDAEIVFVGEAPTEDDEYESKSFAGENGQLLEKALKAMGLARENIYTTYVMKWRPETPTGYGSRTPTPRELAFCLPYLRAQLAVIKPKVVVALGGTTLHALTGDFKKRITEERGRWHTVEGLEVIATFHPSYLLRNPSQTPKRHFWEDLLAVMEKIGMPISEKQRGFFR